MCLLIIGITVALSLIHISEPTRQVPANLAGLPAISIPCGFDTRGLPIGMQLIGNVLEEDRILNAANIFEIDAQVIKKRPLF